VSVSQVVLLLVLPSVAIYLGVAVLAAGRRRTRRTRYRPGDAWNHEPVWWSANPAGAALPADRHDTVETSEARGGAGGVW
jgi:hypothetical protein